MLEAAVGEEGTGKLARVPGLRVAGKTGTAEFRDGDAGERTYASFVGTVLDREPRFVALVGLVGPREGGTGPSAAAPTFARIVAALAR
jgi:cell division protein FtsI (penicillin-binding protein 3)